MIEKKKKKTTLGIKPVNIFIRTIGVIGSIVTITLAVIYLQFTLFLISVLSLISIILTVFLSITVKRLKGMRKEYNELVGEYNKLVNEYNFASENRETLSGMVEDKNKEIEEIKFILNQRDSVISVLWFFYESDLEDKPNRKDLKHAMQIESDQVIIDEKQRI